MARIPKSRPADSTHKQAPTMLALAKTTPAPPPALVQLGFTSLPSLFVAPGERAAKRFLEFFTANIRNPSTREAYFRAASYFSAWCDQHGLALHDFSIIFAYPWPDEEHLTETLFEHYAAPDALLVTYHGGEDFRLRRKCGG